MEQTACSWRRKVQTLGVKMSIIHPDFHCLWSSWSRYLGTVQQHFTSKFISASCLIPLICHSHSFPLPFLWTLLPTKSLFWCAASHSYLQPQEDGVDIEGIWFFELSLSLRCDLPSFCYHQPSYHSLSLSYLLKNQCKIPV